MVNVKNAIAFGLLAATASAATLKHDKRHVHHRRHNKPACTTSGLAAPFPVHNSTLPAGTGAASSSTSSREVVTVSVVPVPVTSSPSVETTSAGAEASSVVTTPTDGSGSVPSSPAGGDCAAPATSYVTIQETITVTAGAIPESTAAPVVPSSSSIVSQPTTTKAAASTTLQEQHTTTTSEVVATPEPTPEATSAASSASSAAVESSAAPASTPVNTGSYTGKKMGTSWIPPASYESLGLSGVDWIYNWEQTAQGVPAGVDFVPTLHDADKCANFASQLAAQPGVTFVKHFNEPDMSGGGGSGLSVAQAASLHNQYIKPLAGKYQIGLPAVTSNNVPGTSGTGWLTSFVEQVGCDDFAFADFHFYGGGEAIEKQAEIFLGYVDDWVSTTDKICPGKNLPIWITEFSCGPVANGDASDAARFMAVAGPKLEANNRVAKYSYFFPSNSQSTGVVNGILTALKAAGI